MYFAGDSMKNVCCLIQHTVPSWCLFPLGRNVGFASTCVSPFLPPNILFTYLSPLMRVRVASLTSLACVQIVLFIFINCKCFRLIIIIFFFVSCMWFTFFGDMWCSLPVGLYHGVYDAPERLEGIHAYARTHPFNTQTHIHKHSLIHSHSYSLSLSLLSSSRSPPTQ